MPVSENNARQRLVVKAWGLHGAAAADALADQLGWPHLPVHQGGATIHQQVVSISGLGMHLWTGIGEGFVAPPATFGAAAGLALITTTFCLRAYTPFSAIA